MIELTWNGTEPLSSATASDAHFLEDGDEVVLRAARPLGEVRGRIVPS